MNTSITMNMHAKVSQCGMSAGLVRPNSGAMRGRWKTLLCYGQLQL